MALVLSLGGAALAAKTAKRNSVTSKSVKNNALTGTDVKDDSLTGSDITDDSLTGSDINESSLSLPAAPAELLAYARVAADGTVDPARSKNVLSADHDFAGTGRYCIDLADGVEPHGMQTTIDIAGADPRDSIAGTADRAVASSIAGCGPGTDAFVATHNWVTPVQDFIDIPFYVVFY